MNIEACGVFYFKSPIKPDDGRIVCSRTGSVIEEIKVCLTGPMITLPRTGEELRQVIEATQQRWRREKIGSPDIVVVR